MPLCLFTLFDAISTIAKTCRFRKAAGMVWFVLIIAAAFRFPDPTGYTRARTIAYLWPMILAWILTHPSWFSAARIEPRVIFHASSLLIECVGVVVACSPFWLQRTANERWSAFWANPNDFGSVSALAFVVALYHAAWHARNKRKRPRSADNWFIWTHAIASALTLIALVNSGSRGAWLAAVVGCWGLWPLVTAPARSCAGRETMRASRLFAWAAITVFVSAIIYWSAPTRLISLMDPTDLSWGNRLSSWSGGLAMMTDNWMGVGWRNVVTEYAEWYCTLDIVDPMAITTNSLLMAGAAAGVPSFVVFVSIIWSFLLDNGQCIVRHSNYNIYAMPIIQRSVVLTCVVSAVLDDGMVVWPISVGLWLALFALADYGDDQT